LFSLIDLPALTGVSFEDRQDFLENTSDHSNTHYSAPDIERLVEAAEAVIQVEVTPIYYQSTVCRAHRSS